MSSIAQASYRGAQHAVKQGKRAAKQGFQAVEALPTPAKYGVYAGLGGVACAVVAPLAAPAILGGAYGISAAGPVAGGAFAGFQAAAAGGAIAAGSSLAVIQGIAMGAALPAIGYLGAAAAGVAVAVGARAGADAASALCSPAEEERDGCAKEEKVPTL